LDSGRRYRNAAALVSVIFLLCQAWLYVGPLLRENGPDRVHLGFPHIPTDHYAYMMYASQTVRDGSLLTDNMFTTAPQDGRFLMLGLAAAGAVESIVNLPSHVVWHSLRILVLAVFCVLLFRLCLAVFHEGHKALAAHAFVLFSGGLDWILRPLAGEWFAATGAPWSNILHNPWNFSVFWAATNLVWAIPLTIVTAAILVEIRGPGRPLLRGLARGLVFAVLWFIHPYTALVWGLIVAGAVLLPGRGTGLWRSIVDNLPAALGPALVGIFLQWSQQDPVVAASNAQTALWKLSYPVYLWPLVYGPWLFLPLALFFARYRQGLSGLRWLLLWLGAGCLMTANPLVTGAKFQVAFAIPLALLEAAALLALAGRLSEAGRSRTLYRLLVAVAILIVSQNSLSGLILDVNTPESRAAATTTNGHIEQLEALAGLPDGGVLCDPFEGMLVPWKAGKAVFVGQWFLSTRYMEKAELVRWFFSEGVPRDRLAGFLNTARIRWILYGPAERRLGSMPTIPGLVPVATLGDRQIWEWKDGPDS